jgi:cytochrome c2
MSDTLIGTLLSDPEEKEGDRYTGATATLEEDSGAVWSIAAWNETGEVLKEYVTGDKLALSGLVTDMNRNMFTAYHIEEA